MQMHICPIFSDFGLKKILLAFLSQKSFRHSIWRILQYNLLFSSNSDHSVQNNPKWLSISFYIPFVTLKMHYKHFFAHFYKKKKKKLTQISKRSTPTDLHHPDLHLAQFFSLESLKTSSAYTKTSLGPKMEKFLQTIPLTSGKWVR